VAGLSRLEGSVTALVALSAFQEKGLLNWYAIRVKPRHEKVVAAMLNSKGFDRFLPLYKRSVRYAGRRREHELPLFPGYVFSCFDALNRLPILVTPGVIYIVGTPEGPTPLDASEIDGIRRAVELRLSLQPHPYLGVGDKVCITDGPLAGVEGILIESRTSVRLVLSVSLLQRSVLLEIERERVSRYEPG
jgi:transcriptional antiterminator NusG